MVRSESNWPARPESVGCARRIAANAAERAGADDQVLEAVRLAVSEAVSNVVVHGYVGAPEGAFTLFVDWGPEELQVTVRDRGRGMRARTDSPGLGLGLPLIARLAESYSVSAPPGGGTQLDMTFPLH